MMEPHDPTALNNNPDMLPSTIPSGTVEYNKIISLRDVNRGLKIFRCYMEVLGEIGGVLNYANLSHIRRMRESQEAAYDPKWYLVRSPAERLTATSYRDWMDFH
jgi:hypothetical protein